MSVVAARVTVGTSAVPVVAADVYGKAASVRNRGSVSVFLGGSAVTTGTGYELAVGEAVAVPLTDDDVVYGISGTAGQRVDVLVAGAEG